MIACAGPRSKTEFYPDTNRLELNGGVVRFSAKGEVESRLGSRFTGGLTSKARIASRLTRPPLLRTNEALKANKLTFIAWGDSITQCGTAEWNGGATATELNWVHLLARNLEKQHPGLKVVETADGVGGQNVAESLCRDPVQTLNNRGNVDLFLIELGTNDQAFHIATPAQFADSLRQMITQLITAYDCDIVILTPGPLPETKAVDPPEVYINTMKQVGKEFNVPVVDMTSAVNEIIAANNKNFTDYHNGPTNCHPNDLGHQTWANIILTALEKATQPIP